MLIGGREKVTSGDVVFDCGGLDGDAGDGVPLDKGDCVAGKEVVLWH